MCEYLRIFVATNSMDTLIKRFMSYFITFLRHTTSFKYSLSFLSHGIIFVVYSRIYHGRKVDLNKCFGGLYSLNII